MPVGFGRVAVDGVLLDDPYNDGIETLSRFELFSDQGSCYSVERVGLRRWSVSRVEPTPVVLVGKVTREGTAMNRRYFFKRDRRLFSAGWQNGFMNAVFGLVGEMEA